MSNKKMGVLESRFADFIWNNEPVTSGQLVKMAEKELSWKSTTSYTVLKRLCERGIFQNKDGAVTSLKELNSASVSFFASLTEKNGPMVSDHSCSLSRT